MLYPHCFREKIKSKSVRLCASTLHACSLLLVQRFGKPGLATSGHQKMIPPHSSFWGKKREHASKPRCGWWMGCSWQAQEKATHSLGRESVHLPMQRNKTNGDSGRGESRKEHHNEVDKHARLNLFFSLFSSPYGIEVKAFWCREKYLRGFSNNASPCHWCRLLLLCRRLSLWAEQRCMFLRTHYHLNMWAFKKQIRMFLADFYSCINLWYISFVLFCQLL